MDLSYRTSCWMNFNKYTFDLDSVHAVMSPGRSKTFEHKFCQTTVMIR